MTTTDPEVFVNFTLRDSGDGEKELRTIGLGLQPLILIEPEVTDDSMSFNVDATDLDAEGLVSILRLLADQLEENKDNFEWDDEE